MRLLLLSLALVASACGGDSSEAFDATTYDGGATDPALEGDPVDLEGDDLDAPDVERPATETATISIEGMDETVGLRLVRYDDVPLPFSTYLPEGWSDDVMGSGEGTAVQFRMGEPPMQGLVSLFVPSDPNQAGVAGLARAMAESRGGFAEFEDGEAPAWASGGFSFSDDSGSGSVSIGKHAGISFYVVEEFPYEMGDGFVPRAEMIQDRLVWLDDGTGL